MSPICNELRREFQQKFFICLFVCPSIILTIWYQSTSIYLVLFQWQKQASTLPLA
jgi:hypothetical protein